jgi:hypothetical protein
MKFSRTGRVEDGHSGPFLLVAEGITRPVLAPHIGLIIGENQIVVIPEQGVRQGLEKVPLPPEEISRGDLINSLAEIAVGLLIVSGVIASGLQPHNFLYPVAEEEEIFGIHFLRNLHIRPIQAPDGERPVHRELHVTGP